MLIVRCHKEHSVWNFSILQVESYFQLPFSYVLLRYLNAHISWSASEQRATLKCCFYYI